MPRSIRVKLAAALGAAGMLALVVTIQVRQALHRSLENERKAVGIGPGAPDRVRAKDPDLGHRRSLDQACEQWDAARVRVELFDAHNPLPPYPETVMREEFQRLAQALRTMELAAKSAPPSDDLEQQPLSDSELNRFKGMLETMRWFTKKLKHTGFDREALRMGRLGLDVAMSFRNRYGALGFRLSARMSTTFIDELGELFEQHAFTGPELTALRREVNGSLRAGLTPILRERKRGPVLERGAQRSGR